MSKLLDQLNGKSLQDVQNARKKARDSTGSTPGNTPPTPPEQAQDVPRETSQVESQEASFPASQVPTHPDSFEAGNSTTQPAGKPRSRKGGIRGLSEALAVERTQVTKLTLDVAPDTKDRLNRAVQHFGRGAQRKIVEYALDAALTELGY